MIKFKITENEQEILKGIRNRNALMYNIFVRAVSAGNKKMDAYKSVAELFGISARLVRKIISERK